ncbi:hypothetical protein L083_3888 [Actinoplanes sp. N902-109]|nr:hypothetical protein L083_3888 [Actinoplanes sp. N902-109]
MGFDAHGAIVKRPPDRAGGPVDNPPLRRMRRSACGEITLWTTGWANREAGRVGRGQTPDRHPE